MEDDGFILVSRDDEEALQDVLQPRCPTYLSEINSITDSLQESLWPLNTFIHDSPELAFKEYKTHDAITKFLESQEDWEVTRSAYGMDTAWVAVYAGGKAGPVVSFNAEMGMFMFFVLKEDMPLIFPSSRCAA